VPVDSDTITRRLPAIIGRPILTRQVPSGKFGNYDMRAGSGRIDQFQRGGRVGERMDRTPELPMTYVAMRGNLRILKFQERLSPCDQ
jgi:hypothetical protein